MIRARLLRLSERIALRAAVLCSAIALLRFARYERFQRAPEQILNLSHPKGNDRARLAGRLEIRRLRLSIPVLEGDSENNLALGAAHLSDTAPLGHHGNAVVAGHRDSVFRRLADVRNGDEITMWAESGWRYRVVRTRIVSPNEVSVLQDSEWTRLTLLTCYPFRYFGSAPKRFVVEAELVGRANGT